MLKIVLPTLYDGSIEPKEAKEGDIWQNQYTSKVYVFLGEKWFEIMVVKSTGYTEQEEKEMRQKEDEKKSTETKELEKYKKLLREFKDVFEEV